MAESAIIIDFNKALPGKYRVTLKTGEWSEVQEPIITTDNIKGPHFPGIPFHYFLKERPPVSISGESLGTLESLLVLLPDEGVAFKRLFFNGKQLPDRELFRFKPTDVFLDIILMDEASLRSTSRTSEAQ